VDPLTLFALANGAVAAVKKGCQLYKDIKGAAGDVKAVLKDLDDQFHNAYAAKGKEPPPEAKKQLIEEKNRVKELNARDGETMGIYQEIGEHLGVYYDNLNKCMAVFEEEERRSKTQIYDGGASLGHRALQRVLMKKQLEQMSVELREIMVYQCPPELGALYTEVEDMMKVMGKEQKVLIAKHIKQEQARAAKRKREMEKLKHKLYYVGAVVVVIVFWLACMFLVVENRKKEFPELGDGIFPRRVDEYDLIISERNRKYWAEKEQEYRDRRNRK
jgi:hypothetical protein